jgi:heme exporter protein D
VDKSAKRLIVESPGHRYRVPAPPPNNPAAELSTRSYQGYFEHFQAEDAPIGKPRLLSYPTQSHTLLPLFTSVIVRIRRRAFVVHEVIRRQRRRNRLEGERRLGEVETVGEIVGRRVRVAQRR